MPHANDDMPTDAGKPVPRKLVLCFDGTGNVFEGNTSDTNIVKLYDKFDRKDPMQYHYYQTGIGTYNVDGGPVNKTFIGNIQSNISKTLDGGFATTFDAHVIAGYRFIMRYYKEGDRIYIFGFSRGAFTARFLARMIFRVGLLSEGNEEMVPFAYDLYQQYEKGLINAPEQEQDPKTTSKPSGPANGAAASTETELLIPKDPDEIVEPDEQQLTKNKLNAFKTTFCRCDKINPTGGDSADNLGVKVYFLGIFDCVSSVAVLDSPFGKAPKAVSVVGTAHHVRHAVAVDEHRVKFKAALLQQDKTHPTTNDEDIKEVWFPGNHGDVGGGWPAPKPPQTVEIKTKRSWWETVRRVLATWKDNQASVASEDPYQMSDVPLAWMIRELELIGAKDPNSAIRWSNRKDGFKRNFFKKREQAYDSPMHDTLRIGRGSSLFKVMLWNFMEWLPIRRWELQMKTTSETRGYDWAYIMWPPNRREARDIPDGALLHESLLRRLTTKSNYLPSNNRGDNSPPCLVPGKFHPKQKDEGVRPTSAADFTEPPGVHTIYTLKE
ncbi:hypothetical protein BU16DRAFT_523615 [Lophium mytilinum]|uniref:T6SS Phospholipase effector Tle1-like catalytic domain-containing protein n=1 Tax=Lophium mytilinum TaxID=390894 RepID=A0A6A6RAW7_9PEZI|nr:hypothetical protein BU16DRAFT_523615 [Lophium mytilinum]